MLVDIFSTFDDHNQVFMSFYVLLWAFSLIVVLLFSSMFWVVDFPVIEVMNVLKNTIGNQIFRSFGFYLGGFANLITALFLFLVLMNLSGLVPYVFSSTSHLAVSFSLGFPLWLTLILSGCFYNVSSSIASLLPMGAPSFLNPFLVIVETVSIGVRSITLSVRLIANMSAGHIVLSLIGNYLMCGIFTGFISAFFLIFSQLIYTVFEFGIGLIQAYIFCLLIVLYSDDHSH
uniref:ATP synthase F0 subunit 6 n=1 Tax=Cipangopaludina longispira TaxID=889207 RepID=UPI001D12CB80|nr:ATP synthase F0 subunit 6 [Cipangopaludina longispira]UDD73402.1 ATP synthase F0 subunit 6 [Cipangopaludina longispira]